MVWFCWNCQIIIKNSPIFIIIQNFHLIRIKSCQISMGCSSATMTTTLDFELTIIGFVTSYRLTLAHGPLVFTKLFPIYWIFYVSKSFNTLLFELHVTIFTAEISFCRLSDKIVSFQLRYFFMQVWDLMKMTLQLNNLIKNFKLIKVLELILFVKYT